MKKRIIDLCVTSAERVGAGCVLLWLSPVEGRLPEMRPGQFAQLRVDAPDVFLRRPISIHDVDAKGNAVAFLVQIVGKGTQWLADLGVGDVVNAVLPLGNGFTIERGERNVLLIGGGVGVAPLLYLGRVLREKGVRPAFLLGARTREMLLRLDAFREVGEVFVTTEDGSLGERGFVTQHSQLSKVNGQLSIIYACGPMPMMRAVGRWAKEQGIPCEVSLENRMACGVGACLCCVTETRDGHNRCVCTEGPVFDAEALNWD